MGSSNTVLELADVRPHGPDGEVLVARLATDPAIVTITLDRPEVDNVLTPTMMGALASAVDSVTAAAGEPTADDAIRAVILRHSGRAFSVGVDIGDLGDYFEAGFHRAADPFSAMRECPLPIVGAINGVAVTGGFELALLCDVLVASGNALFMDNHPKYGLHPVGGLSWRLSQIVGYNNAKLATLASYPVDARTALSWGLVQRVVDDVEALDREALEIARLIAYNDPAAVRAYKRVHELLMQAGNGPDVEAQSDAGFYEPLGDLEERTRIAAGRFAEFARWAAKRDVTGPTGVRTYEER